VAESFRFVQPATREKIRERYTANWIIPHDLTKIIQRAIYSSAAEDLLEAAKRSDGPLISFGYDLDESGNVEVEKTFSQPVVLYDVRMYPLGWVLRRWWRRCEHDDAILDQDRQARGGLANARPFLIFLPSFDSPIEGRISLCKRRGGVPFTSLERWIIWSSFRFREATE
jgi:hypothetical protein